MHARPLVGDAGAHDWHCMNLLENRLAVPSQLLETSGGSERQLIESLANNNKLRWKSEIRN